MATAAAYLVAALAVYAAICSALRFRFERAMRKKFNYPDRASMAKMTNDDAQAILGYIMTNEFPYIYKLALQFALFKTYGIETISKLLVATTAFVSPVAAPKRYEDTGIIFAAFFLNPPTSPQCLKAIARMNYLHSAYRASGHILNEDMLYTLAVSALEPIRFTRLYEFRPLNDMEVCALGTFWKALGDAMQIEYRGCLARAGTGGWRDGIEFIEDVRAWAKDYEVRCMRPAETNYKLSKALVDMMMFHYPTWMKPFALEALTALMGDRVREAFLYPDPSLVASLVAYAALYARRFVLRFLLPPRITPVKAFSGPDPQTGRMFWNDYLVQPWYTKVTFWSRWGPTALFTRAMGGTVPGEKGEAFLSKGFLYEDIGPTGRMGKGLDFMGVDEERLKRERVSGCPFAVRVAA